MILYKFSRNTEFDIEKLKKNLMETGQTSNKSDDSISKQVINECNGKTFEKNIRRSLEYYFGFEKLEHS